MTTLAGLSDADIEPTPRRVRHEVRDGLLLMVFSGAVSCGAAGLLVLVSRALG